MKNEKYTFGWSDPKGTYGTPKVKWEPISYNHKYDWGLYLAYVGVATGVSMTIAPMAWVQFFTWIFS
jgi:hypothetical protein